MTSFNFPPLCHTDWKCRSMMPALSHSPFPSDRSLRRNRVCPRYFANSCFPSEISDDERGSSLSGDFFCRVLVKSKIKLLGRRVWKGNACMQPIFDWSKRVLSQHILGQRNPMTLPRLSHCILITITRVTIFRMEGEQDGIAYQLRIGRGRFCAWH